MYCKNCGTEVLPDAKFCSACGNAISDSLTGETIAKSPTTSAIAKARKPISLYVASGLLAFGYVFLFMQAGAGQSVPPQIGYGYIFWTGVLFYYWWKQRARNGWRGALIGSVIALVALFVAGFIVGVVGHAK